ncbi:GerMN domain-containing protein [Papillibacter cinnamivorans]|uniref:Sporulation and spore germination n=1 Tax=Papillibacter cinnamivorans DSM 12816 TaxID=1122930 RepID=A0A1W2CYM8_9FIRM|nr:GerMN domain-containing protein [Papillibacter cinnamivorans]SMC90311.1 Sporulation and spore germination [Papillibacter cinnamivorans DSM 12816]
MKRTGIAFVLPLILLLSACGGTGAGTSATPTAGPTETPLSLSDYIPFRENIRMSYSGEGNEYSEFTAWAEYFENGAYQVRSSNPGTDSVSVFTLEDGAVKLVFFRGETYYRQNYTDRREMEEIILQEPIEEGNSWTLDDGAVRTITDLDADVKVPYGTFKALEVTTERDDDTMKEYYVADLGLVKSEFIPAGDASSSVVSQLEMVEENVPYTQTVQFYYPDFNNDRLVYTEKSLELYTGDDIKKIFQQQFISVPEGSGLSPLMSPNASILSISMDDKTGIATVDFSREFLTEMNAGSSLETMLLDSVADTVGRYFQTEKVGITLEGEPYESGHYRIGSGEYWPADWEGIQEYK